MCTEIGPGCPCSPQEQERGEFFKKELEGITDEAKKEEFTCAPNTHLGWFKMALVIELIGVIFYSFSLAGILPLPFAIISTIIAVFVFIIFILEFVFYKEFVDFLYKKKKSSNIIGTIKAKGPVKNLIIFSGHHDSAWQYTWLRYLNGGYYLAAAWLMITVLIALLVTGIRLIQLIIDPSLGNVFSPQPIYWWFILPPAFIFAFFFAEKGKNGGNVPGALDNLAAVATSWTIGRILKRHPELIPNNTEIRLVSFGCEEAGCRGSHRYVQQHLEELKKYDAACFNFESLLDTKIKILTTDINSMVKNSKEFVEEVVKAAEQSGVPFEVEPFKFGGGATDAGRFAEAGIKTMSLFSLKVPEQMIKYYHQEFDNYDIIKKETLGNALKIAVEFLRNRSKST
ncbi:MAG: M20/M25/M40 family metallo-hydrolase [Candidatus Hodarchaeota archaeon]